MQCEITYGLGELTDIVTISIDGFDDDKLSSAIDDAVRDVVQEQGFYDNLIDEAMAQYSAAFEDEGTIDIYEIGTSLYDSAKEYIACRDDIRATAKLLNEQATWSEPLEIDVKSFLEEMINNRSTCEQWDCDVGGEVEFLINNFANNGSWQLGLKTPAGIIKLDQNAQDIVYCADSGTWSKDNNIITPVLWFGYDTPMELWEIDESIEDDDYLCWFLKDKYNSLYRIAPDSDNGSFDVWFFAECGRRIPVLLDFMRKCPISFDAGDGQKVRKQKIDQYFKRVFGIKE